MSNKYVNFFNYFLFVLFLIAGFFIFNNSVYAKPVSIPEIKSFESSDEYSKCLKLFWNSKGADTIEVMNNTTKKLYKFGGATGYTFQGLTKDKLYEVMIRSCDRVDGLYDCTNWSPVKSATAKEVLYNVGNIVLSNTNFIYDGKVKKPTAIVKNDKNVTLKEGTDYKITYPTPGMINTGTYKAVVTGLENYKFTKDFSYKILPAGVKSVTLSKTSYTYNGKIKKPSVKVINNKGKTLVKDKDYLITYPSGRINVGKYIVKVKGKGNYKFDRDLTFKINSPEKLVSPNINDISVTKTSVKISYSHINGVNYQIGYKKSGSSKYKHVTTNNYSYKFSDLKQGTKYSFKVRAFKKVGSLTLYSGWSPIKTVKTDISSSELIAQTAEKLAWPKGTSKKIYLYHYSSGRVFNKWSELGKSRPTQAFMDAYDKVRSNHFNINRKYPATRVGASCDVFVGTVVKYSGYDSIGFGLSSQQSHLPHSSKWKKVSKAKRGDVCKKSSHIKIYLGDGKIAEAGYHRAFGAVINGGCGGGYTIYRATK